VAEDVGPADVAEHEAGLVAIALAGGGATAHAAIVARSLGLPMVVGLGPEVLEIAAGAEVIVDGDRGRVLGSPSPAEASRTRVEMASRAEARSADRERRELPAMTRDGRRLRVLGNAAGAVEVEVALAAGAEGIGLLRTELAFLDAGAWPSEDEHRRALAPVLAAAGGAPVTVRLLDFGGDKLPPFLRGRGERGIALQLSAPGALRAQLAAIADALAAGAQLRVLIPLVEDPAQVRAVRAELPAGAEVGAMVETPGAAARADELAACCAFLSIGTNDLSHAVLGSDRFAAGSAPAHHPRVLAAVARVARATAATEIPLEVCGEAASDPVTMPLLVGLGVDELSVGAARVGTVREWVRRLSAADAAGLAGRALSCHDAADVAALMGGASGVRLDEPGDAGLESVEGGVRTVAVGP
jgi:phosphoenolpyruvate-protein kinase (PTS system EI component)